MIKMFFRIAVKIKKELKSRLLKVFVSNQFFYKIYCKFVIPFIPQLNMFLNTEIMFLPQDDNISNNNIPIESPLSTDIKIFSELINDKIPNWHYDYIYSYKFDKKMFYKSIQIPVGKGDIKTPWEISRFQHLVYVGVNYQITKKDEYVHLFNDLILNWIDNNLPLQGVNWACTMDTAIRATNMILGYLYIKDSKILNHDFKNKFINSLYYHAYFIKSNLEFSYKVNGNHYLSDIVGLLFICFFIHTKESKKWLQFSIKELMNEFDKQVYEDGTDFEASTCYHRLALELFFYPYLLITKNKDNNYFSFIQNHENNFNPYSQRLYSKKLFNMFDAIYYLLKPNGEMPQIGDNDSGQYIKLYPRKVLDMRYLLALGSVFYNNHRWKITEFFKDGKHTNEKEILEVLILYGQEGKEKWDSMNWSSLKEIDSYAFRDSGWYVMRKNLNYCIISCGPNGQLKVGGHSHNDKLSFELFLQGREIIVDPGTYVYTPEPEMRNLFRGTKYHNTVTVDDEEQNRFIDGQLFKLPNEANANCLRWEVTEDIDYFLGEHYGYTRLQDPITHRRKIEFNKTVGKIEIVDSFVCKKEHTFEWNFILHPSIVDEIQLVSNDFHLQKEHCYYSPEYSVKQDTKKISFKEKTKLDFKVTISINSELIFSVKKEKL
jgi:hypothetical protein